MKNANSAAPCSTGCYPPVLDACCGSRMFWFDKADRRALFIDKRRETLIDETGKRPTEIVVDRLQAEPRLSEVAIHDMRYVLQWLLQSVAMPVNIERLSLRAIQFLDEYDEAKIAASAPLTQEEQDRIGL